MKEDVHQELLSKKQDEAWEAAIQNWTDKADIKEYLDRLSN